MKKWVIKIYLYSGLKNNKFITKDNTCTILLQTNTFLNLFIEFSRPSDKECLDKKIFCSVSSLQSQITTTTILLHKILCHTLNVKIKLIKFTKIRKSGPKCQSSMQFDLESFQAIEQSDNTVKKFGKFNLAKLLKILKTLKKLMIDALSNKRNLLPKPQISKNHNMLR